LYKEEQQITVDPLLNFPTKLY